MANMRLTTVGFSENYRSRYTEEHIWLVYWTNILGLFIELQVTFWTIKVSPRNCIFQAI